MRSATLSVSKGSGLIGELAHYARTAAGFVKLAQAATEPEPKAYVSSVIANREENFLALMQQGVFANPVHPYGTLFDWAGCSFEDLRNLVRREGLESALTILYNEGVYLTHDEVKGRVAVKRGAGEFLVDFNNLANPAVQGILDVASSGSRSGGTVTRRSLEFHRHRVAQEQVMRSDWELEQRAIVTVSGCLPATGAIRRLINQRAVNQPVAKWFAQPAPLHYKVLTAMIVVELALIGKPVIFPEYLPHNDFSPVARYIARRKREGKLAVLHGGVSKLVRVAAAALEEGLDISGTLVNAGGEALTDAKRAVIESAGCEVHARYTISELGPIGVGCRRMTGNCVHVYRDSVAVISRRRTAPLTDIEVESLLFTSLLPSAANILVNVEMDDAGELGPARCGCDLEKMGFTQQIDKIFSYGKLTGYGTSLVGGDLLHILENLLPKRFGGVPNDYQLVEREGQNQTEYELRVNPRVGVTSEKLVLDYFLGEVKRLYGGSLTVGMWVHGDGVKVALAEPYMGSTGKVLSLHLLGTTTKTGKGE